MLADRCNVFPCRLAAAVSAVAIGAPACSFYRCLHKPVRIFKGQQRIDDVLQVVARRGLPLPLTVIEPAFQAHTPAWERGSILGGALISPRRGRGRMRSLRLATAPKEGG